MGVSSVPAVQPREPQAPVVDSTGSPSHEGDASLRALLMTLPEAVVVAVADRVELVNHAAQRLFGVDEAALLDQPPTHPIHADSAGAVREYLSLLGSGAVPTPLKGVRIARPDGEHRVVEISCSLVNGLGRNASILVFRDVTALLQARSELAASRGELQRLLAARDRIQEAERRRIARELHDDLQQSLAAILIDVNAAAQRYPVPTEVRWLLDNAGSLASASIESTRRIINDLRPQMLEDLGLLPALEALVSQFRRSSGIDCQLHVCEESGKSDEPISPQVATCLYRVTQEGLRNIGRHAQADRAEVSFSRMRRGLILLRISDNGRGIRADEPRRADSFGLIGMRERVRALGALLRVDSGPGEGTTIHVVVPAAIAAMAPALEVAHLRKIRTTAPP